ncbi:luciferase-like, subgroup [Methylocaldum marinum]|uniref:Luciferase-like, subgroup n=2 Tax=Methylocaldum marinum TaxID=1432792 RepID=A0A250KTS7_9GAMM|nr:luciferase-like, subgroup [Methylocaldum marinum]
MRFGLSGCGAGLEAADPDDWIELAERAERLGFSSLWINEEHFQRRDHTSGGRHCLSPLIVAAAMAARTRHIRIGFSVLLQRSLERLSFEVMPRLQTATP